MKQIDLYTALGEPTGETLDFGQPLPKDRYHLVTELWVRNTDGAFLAVKKVPDTGGGQMAQWSVLMDDAYRNESSFLCTHRLFQEEAGVRMPADQGRMVHRIVQKDAQGIYRRLIREIWLYEYDEEAMARSKMQTIVRAQEEDAAGLHFVSASQIEQMLASGEMDRRYDYFTEKIAGLDRVAPVRKGYRTVSFSRAEVSRAIRYPDINGQGRLFGGRLLEWIDECAGIASMRHAGQNVATVSIEHLEFKKGAYANDQIMLIANVTHVGGSSIEVRVDTWLEDLESGMRTVINRAFLTEVCIDGDGRPVPVQYGLIMELESEMAKWEGAQRRINARKQGKREGF